MPHRPWTLFVLLLLCTTLITGLVALHGYLTIERYPVAIEVLPAVNLAASNNLSVWFCSALLAAGAILSLLIYQIRRYRTDDYRGRYRMWFWFAAVLMLGSVNSVADLEYTIRTASLHAAGIPDYADALLIGTAVTAFILLVLGLRLAIELRACWPALVSLAVSVGCIATVFAIRLGWLWTEAEMFRVMANALLLMVGHAALFFSLCLYGSFVYREANGLSKRTSGRKKKRRPRRKQTAVEAEVSETPERPKTRRRREPQSAESESRTPKKRVRPSREEAPVENRGKKRADSKSVKRRVDQPAPSPDREDAEPEAEDMAKLSKAERRRLRKQRRRERQQQ
jgi:hypothetical protein